MQTDPGQTTPINARDTELARRLADDVRAWRREMFGKNGSEDSPRRDRRSASTVDPRPSPVGYREFPRTWLPARDGEPRGGARRSSGAPNCSYFVNWTHADDSLVWKIDVHTAGEYEVEIDYTCPIADAGSTVELSFKNNRVTGKVEPGWDPPLYENQDTLPRPSGESQMKEFRPLKLGRIHLEAGVGPLVLRATEIPGKEVMHVRAVTLTLVD